MSRRARPKRREERGRHDANFSGTRSHLRWTLPILTAMVLVSGLTAGGFVVKSLFSDGPPPGPKTAAIVDQLSLTQPAPDFIRQATSLLRQAGYAVDYYPGEEVTVDFYRYLPTRHHDLIILRTHSGLVEAVDLATGGRTTEEFVGLFTSERYSETKYHDEQQPRVGRLAPLGSASYSGSGNAYFSIGPTFIEDSMKGHFNDAAIIMMGCDGLRSQRTAQAFLDRGAKAFVSWSLPVSASHTDRATARLLELLVGGDVGIGEAVARTAADVGPDPWYGAELRLLDQ